MKTRILRIAPECWVMMLSRPDGWQVVKHRLPEDAKLVGVHIKHSSPTCTLPATVHLEVTSSVFRDDDPEFLPEMLIRAIVLEPGR